MRQQMEHKQQLCPDGAASVMITGMKKLRRVIEWFQPPITIGKDILQI